MKIDHMKLNLTDNQRKSLLYIRRIIGRISLRKLVEREEEEIKEIEQQFCNFMKLLLELMETKDRKLIHIKKGSFGCHSYAMPEIKESKIDTIDEHFIAIIKIVNDEMRVEFEKEIQAETAADLGDITKPNFPS